MNYTSIIRKLPEIISAEPKWYSILPPLVSVALALITKEVISSLLIGILLGSFIYVIVMHLSFVEIFQLPLSILSMNISDGSTIILFGVLLGALVYVIKAAGGTEAYGRWALKAIKTKRYSKLTTILLGMILFVDDYFSCITSATVMKPVSDVNMVSREKLAYIADGVGISMPVLIPISSWAAVIISTMEESEYVDNGLMQLIRTIPFNLYSILTIVMELILAITGMDFGPMADAELKASTNKDQNINDDANDEREKEPLEKLKGSDKGRVYDLLLPNILLIILVFLFMIYQGGGFSGNGRPIEEIFGNSDAALSLSISTGICILVCLFMFLPRKIMTFTQFIDYVKEGMKMMIPTIMILCLAWGLGSITKDFLLTGEWIGDVLRQANFPNQILPFIVFLLSSILSFSIGSAWGTFGILIPIVNGICGVNCPELLTICLASVLSGSIFGDHCSPISDTTVLSSLSSQCNLIDHVKTQLPYGLTVLFCCAIGFLFGGISGGLVYVTLPVGIITEFIVVGLLLYLQKKGILNKFNLFKLKIKKSSKPVQSSIETVEIKENQNKINNNQLENKDQSDIKQEEVENAV